MHNNFTLDKTPKPPKQSYTVVEAAVHWARSDGAKSANNPLIGRYTGLILESLARGDLNAEKGGLLSASSVIASADLKNWMTKYFPDARPAFLFKKNIIRAI